MIYAGLIHFNASTDRTQKLESVLASYTQTPPAVISKSSLILCYGKLSNEQDVDELWENSSSLLIGRVFAKEQQVSFEKKDFKNLAHLDKERVLARNWGKYVYIHFNEKISQFDIVVDSTGDLPFFYYLFSNGNILFSSNIEIIFKILAQKPEYNWTYLCSYLIYGNSSALQTPFNDIYELPPGCCLKITKNERKTEPFWNPLCSYKTSAYREQNAVNVLQETLKPWIRPYKNIYVSLSGGLDSSSLVYCLNDILNQDQTLKALNYFHPYIKSSNELVYARKVCQETGIELIEIDASQSLPFDCARNKYPLKPNKPFPGLISLRWQEAKFDHISLVDSSVFLNGHGSDHIFMRSLSRRSVSDYIIEKGFKGSTEKLKNITQFYRDTLFSAFKTNAISLVSYLFSQRLDKRHPRNNHNQNSDWIKEGSYRRISSDFIHPIYRHLSKKILPGKYDQIDALYEGLASIHMEMNQFNPTFYPFLYEPVVEFALSLPAYDLFDNGYDRYPLRKAISDHFKTETVWRRDKSQTTGVFQLGIKKNLEHVLELCLAGRFVKQDLIDKERLYQTIMLISNGNTNHMRHFMYLASCEVFFRYWDEKDL